MGYIASHWRGDQPLVQSYWVNGVLLNVVFSIVLGILEDWLPGTVRASAFFAIRGGLTLFGIVLTVWACVGIWRSAKNHKEMARQSTPKGSTAWATLAQVLAILGVLAIAGQWTRTWADFEAAGTVEEGAWPGPLFDPD